MLGKSCARIAQISRGLTSISVGSLGITKQGFRRIGCNAMSTVPTLFHETFLENLFRVCGDAGSTGLTTDFLSRSLSLPVREVNQLGKHLVAEGYIRHSGSEDQPGYILTIAGARYFAKHYLGVPPALLERPLGAASFESLVAYVSSQLKGRALKTYLHSAFRSKQYPVFRRATPNNISRLIEDHNAPFRCKSSVVCALGVDRYHCLQSIVNPTAPVIRRFSAFFSPPFRGGNSPSWL
jgi:hypothetical protein